MGSVNPPVGPGVVDVTHALTHTHRGGRARVSQTWPFGGRFCLARPSTSITQSFFAKTLTQRTIQ